MKIKKVNNILIGLIVIGMLGFSSCEKKEIAKIIGFVQGHAFDGNTNAVLDSVKVEWSIAGKKDSTTSTVEDGYLISNLNSGYYSLWFSKDNYTTVESKIYITTTSYDVAIRGGSNSEYVLTYNPNLYPLNANLTGRLYKNENGINVPISGATVELDYNSLSKQQEEGYSFIPGSYKVTTDADGYYTFTNVPATTVYLKFHEFTDSNGETYFDNTYGSHTNTYREINLSSGSSFSYDPFSLTRVTDAIRLTETNLFVSPNVTTNDFDVTSDITLTFNKNVDQTNTESLGFVRLEVGGVEVDADITFTDNVITINPTQDLSPNTNYTVDYFVYGAQTYDNTGSQTISFKTLDDAVVPVQVTGFAIDMGAGWMADYNSDNIDFEFNTISNATKYEIYARDDYENSEYIYINEIGQADSYVALTNFISANLPAQFDYYTGGTQTPFSHGTAVSYKVRAVNSAGAGPFSSEISITDETAFDAGDMNLLNQNATADNTAGGTALTITVDLDISTNRYANVATIPSFGIYNGGVLVAGTSISFVWDDHQNGTVTISIPAVDNYVGYELRLWGVEDSSGNIQDAADYEPQTLF